MLSTKASGGRSGVMVRRLDARRGLTLLLVVSLVAAVLVVAPRPVGEVEPAGATSAYEAAVLASGPKAYWPFREGDSAAVDIASGLDGIVQGDAVQSTADGVTPSGALQLDGSGDFIDFIDERVGFPSDRGELLIDWEPLGLAGP